MPEKKGWFPRKRRENTPFASLQRVDKDAVELSSRHRRPLTLDKDKSTLRQVISASRPGTPGRDLHPPPTEHEIDEDRASETSSRRKSDTKPKLHRYWSNLTGLSPDKPPVIVSEPWSEDFPLFPPPFVDPLEVVQSVRSHINRIPTESIPLQHTSGLLRVFEDYRKVREAKERLDALIKDLVEDYKKAEETWNETEDRYQAEIRRLELIIARGASGMSVLMKARQGSIIDKRQSNKKRMRKDPAMTAFELLTRDQLDVEILQRSQRVNLRRPSSPSESMAVLSQHFSSSNATANLSVGTPPIHGQDITLSRKVKSELDLAKMAALNASNSTIHSAFSEFSSTGDPLPDEIDVPSTTIQDAIIDSEAFVALRELGVLVARRKGINSDRFVIKLMTLLNDNEEDEPEKKSSLQDSTPTVVEEDALEVGGTGGGVSSQHSPRLRRYQSQPHLTSDRDRRRHFSFEPGEDELRILNQKLNVLHEAEEDTLTSSRGDWSPKYSKFSSDSSFEASPTGSMTTRYRKSSMIPSPVHESTIATPRREASISSLQTVVANSNGDEVRRQNSRSSVLTAFRKNSQGTLVPQSSSSSRSSSINNLSQAESRGRDRASSSRNSMAAVAATRAAERYASMSYIWYDIVIAHYYRSNSLSSSSPARHVHSNAIPPTPPSAKKSRGPTKAISENNAPGNAGVPSRHSISDEK
ncbi:hypothetical protein EJ04DRAFT_429414 [Polyplosphaeria fusca]|uniref:Uncharacterized protein n=1 Tax=Polyplosphaeria fusca TaxID=682080 RepID=A0A9P4V4Y1_9PLEO|nr:hypothetical protein EJ04DRAFT_429414 [Polyplosphaeria fusca]